VGQPGLLDLTLGTLRRRAALLPRRRATLLLRRRATLVQRRRATLLPRRRATLLLRRRTALLPRRRATLLLHSLHAGQGAAARAPHFLLSRFICIRKLRVPLSVGRGPSPARDTSPVSLNPYFTHRGAALYVRRPEPRPRRPAEARVERVMGGGRGE
jgi:hypothetical protein